MPGVRRSRRAQVPSKRYNDELADDLNDILGSDSEIDYDRQVDDAEDDEFDEQDAEVAAQEENDVQDEASDVEAGRSSADDGAIDLDADYDNDVIEFATPTLKSKQKPTKRELLTVEELGSLPAFDPRGMKPSRSEPVHSKAIIELSHHDTKQRQVLTSFGPGTEDVAAYIRTRNKWFDQPCLPTKKANSQTGAGGLAYSFFYLETKREKEQAAGWEWYYNHGGMEAFRKSQKSVDLPIEQSHSFRPSTDSRCDLSYGSPNHPLHTALPCGEVVDLSDAWDDAIERHKGGFVVNVGGRVRCLEWVPNQSGSKQYLCTSVQRSSYQDEGQFIIESDKVHGAKAYTPSPRFYSCMEVWEVEMRGEPTMNKPQRRAIFSWDWGDLEFMQWCPVPTRQREELEENADSNTRLGLLAGIWSDGYVRVLDLSFGKQHSTQYTHISHAAFESKPHDTVPTHLCWLSSQNFAASCANGFVCIWDLTRTLAPSHSNDTSSQSPSNTAADQANPRPWFYHQLHQSYIYNITSGYPSRPHMLFTNSIDGYMRVTDLRCPTMDTATVARSRVVLPVMAWSDHTQSLVSTDENLTMKLHPLRRLYSATLFARCEALVTCFAVSTVHPFLLSGCTDGKVWASNPVKRSGGRQRPGEGKGGGSWMLCWFEHTWRRSLDTPKASDYAEDMNRGEPMDIDFETPRDQEERRKQEILKKPLIRIVDGFKAIRPWLSVNLPLELRGKSKHNKGAPGGSTITIHEERTAITKVAWNPNLDYGTWAAAATASGLVRIEDLAADVG